ncbi:STAS domain-containing protein [Actinomadura sp. WMMB 499]|uniref:STAS domain-containing protein n=1 Tax=Actinomadura sp. WMMB 499 TaxID=1219491 RepID=UPI001248C312|nr:STAS domain-containing protein [Actinomadura sp. WMMB 499]QFG26463.1 STAS domain-containing protein [Actinomadura sp. WMMB 499]
MTKNAAGRAGRPGPEIRCTGTAVLAPPRDAAAPAALPGLEIDLGRVRGDTAIVAVSGEIDLHTADTLRARLVALHASGLRSLVVDFAGVAFCDATGLGALVAAHNEISAGDGRIALARVRPAQRRLLRITGLHRLFTVHNDPDEAFV